ENTLESECENFVTENDDQLLERELLLTSKCYGFLFDIVNFYNDTFISEVGISLLHISYEFLSTELAARLQPILTKVYSQVKTKVNDCKDQLTLQPDTTVWKLFKKTGRIIRYGEKLSTCALSGYQRWFA
ncbi:unnamed protein product, partial [Meganyctiphanes norvegica]